MKKELLIHPAIVLVIYVPLLLSFILGGPEYFSLGYLLPVSIGLLAFSILIAELLLSTRPKIIEQSIGLPALYSMHGITAFVILGIIFVHILIVFINSYPLMTPWFTIPLGFAGFILLIIASAMGILFLSSILVSKSKKLSKFRDAPRRREKALWVHRIALVAMLLIFGHVISMPPVRENIVFATLMIAAVGFTLGYYAINKYRTFQRTHILIEPRKAAKKVFEMTFTPTDDRPFLYRDGQYAFVRFIDSDLPQESHPFSFTSTFSPADKNVSVMAKVSGDFTGKLSELKKGNTASLEGPYGNFWSEEVSQRDTPIVLLASGIGITPFLSIIKGLQKGTPFNRRVELIWGASKLDDTFDLDILKSLEQENPGFTFTLVLSREEVAGYSHGRIDEARLEELEIHKLYPHADFLICGPPPMMASLENILLNNGVDKSRIHLEKFSF